MKNLEVFNQRGFGDYSCSSCRTPLLGTFTAIGEVGDENGYEWRSFCPRCESKLGIATISDSDPKLNEIYSNYPIPDYLGN